MPFVRVANVNEVPEGGGREVTAGGKAIALFKLNGKLYAIGAICLHKGGPLADGMLDENIVTCPLHNWRYDITNGKCLNSAGSEPSYKVEVQGTDVLVDV